MTFRNENAATTTINADNAEAGRKRNRLRMALMGGALVALPVAGLVTATTASAASTSTWDSVAQCESTGNWGISTGNGFSGGLQFTPSTWAAYGGTAYASSADQATKGQQIAVAEKVLASQGPGAWPVCSVKAGLTAGGAAATVDTSSSSSSSSSSSNAATSNSASSKAAGQSTAPSTKQSTDQSTAAAPKQSAAQNNTTQNSTQNTAPSGNTGSKHAAKSAATGGSYTVKSGDTLSDIAAAHGTSVASLYSHNAQVIGGDIDMILPGQVLAV